VLTVEYGNGTSKAALQVDLQSYDVYVDMSGRPARPDTAVRPPAPAAPQAPYAAPTVVQAAPVPASQSSSVRTDSVLRREETRSIVEAATREGGERSRDSVTARVVSLIQKSQAAFYQGSYAEALSLAEQSIHEHPTAEAHALAGSVAWTQKDFDSARRHWRATLAIDPDFPGVSAMLGKLPAEDAP
jgi:hypothetical protein